MPGRCARGRNCSPMGDRGATATKIGSMPSITYCSRWEIGEQPQHVEGIGDVDIDCSRWEIGEQPQLEAAAIQNAHIVADGRSGSNRNVVRIVDRVHHIVADGRSGSNRNLVVPRLADIRIVADGRSRSNRNSLNHVCIRCSRFCRLSKRLKMKQYVFSLATGYGRPQSSDHEMEKDRCSHTDVVYRHRSMKCHSREMQS